MNQIQPYPTDVHQPHMSGGSVHGSSSGPPAIGHYGQYPHQQQPPLLHPGPQAYSSAPSYQYSYNGIGAQSAGNPAATPMSSAMVPQSLPLPAMPNGPGVAMGATQNYSTHQFDTTGQIAPPGMKPRVTATLWEDEGSLCFQVEARGVCVARREDNHMINGTKLLNVAGMTRGRRDGILKSEKTRHVVKIGPMHLKGVWIPFERALDFANKEKITEQLYPLFVHDIGALLYHPSNQTRGSVGNNALAAIDRRNPRFPSSIPPSMPATSQASSLHHHHALSTPSGNLLTQSPHSIAPHPGPTRPELGRAHTFPTPPASASSIMGVGSGGASSYEWSNPGNSNVQSNQPLSIDTGLSNARSVPTTPATTPPAHNMGSMQQYQTSQAYDASRQLYTAPPTATGQYGSQPGMNRFNPLQPSPFPKSDMAPPARTAGEGDASVDAKSHSSYGPSGEPIGPGQVLGEEHEDSHDNEYTHTSAPTQASYGYNPNAPVGGLHDDHGSSPHQNGAGQATPRTTNTAQTYLPQAYTTPQRTQTAPASSSLYNVISHPQAAAPNGAPQPDAYPSSYQAQAYASSNGATPGTKRGRDDDDDGQDPYGRDDGETGPDGLKRRKTIREDNAPAGLNRTKSTPVARRR